MARGGQPAGRLRWCERSIECAQQWPSEGLSVRRYPTLRRTTCCSRAKPARAWASHPSSGARGCAKDGRAVGAARTRPQNALGRAVRIPERRRPSAALNALAPAHLHRTTLSSDFGLTKVLSRNTCASRSLINRNGAGECKRRVPPTRCCQRLAWLCASPPFIGHRQWVPAHPACHAAECARPRSRPC